MSEKPEVFISFSGKDQRKVRQLFSALEIQNVLVWDYSDEGQELPIAQDLGASLKAKIDSCEYFIAVISPNSVDENIGSDPYLEVRYAIDSGKGKNNRILPLLLDAPSDQWLTLYEELKRVLWIPFKDDGAERFEDTIRRICDWLSAPYIPPSLKDPRVFFANLFLEELRGKTLNNAQFVKLLKGMNGSANELLMNDWSGVKEKTSFFLNLAAQIAPEVPFHYPLVIKGLCELELGQLEDAEQTFLHAANITYEVPPPLLPLGFAGLGHTYFSQQRFDKSLEAFQQAIDLQPQDQPHDSYLQFNYFAALISSGGILLDEKMLDLFDPAQLSAEERLKVTTLKAELSYKKGSYQEAISAFSGLSWNDLGEASAIYYSLTLQANGEPEKAIEVLRFAANRTKSTNLYHYLADAYLGVSDLRNAVSIYEDVLCRVAQPSDFARQILVEYAQIIRVSEGENKKFREACERAVNVKLLPSPQSKADWFFTGFAYHLLGRSDLARHYYDNSSGFSAQYYDELELTNGRRN